MGKRAATTLVFSIVKKKRYGFWAFMGDSFMTVLTGGFWLIWVAIRHARNH